MRVIIVIFFLLFVPTLVLAEEVVPDVATSKTSKTITCEKPAGSGDKEIAELRKQNTKIVEWVNRSLVTLNKNDASYKREIINLQQQVDQASRDASEAKAKANTAIGNATTAIKTAGEANSNAVTAKTDATEAKIDAAAAKGSAKMALIVVIGGLMLLIILFGLICKRNSLKIIR